ncbi:MAG: peptidylprolyl isomerase, partial [Sphingomonadaceae bacterium]
MMFQPYLYRYRLACLSLASLAAFALAPFSAARSEDAAQERRSPGEIIAQAQESEWWDISPESLLVMQLAPDRQGSARQVVIQLIPFPFSQGWVDNVRTLARSHWYDGTAITRVQDNYVVQWGDPHGDEAERAKPVPDGLIT